MLRGGVWTNARALPSDPACEHGLHIALIISKVAESLSSLSPPLCITLLPLVLYSGIVMWGNGSIQSCDDGLELVGFEDGCEEVFRWCNKFDILGVFNNDFTREEQWRFSFFDDISEKGMRLEIHFFCLFAFGVCFVEWKTV
jgi:hypothetical protein